MTHTVLFINPAALLGGAEYSLLTLLEGIKGSDFVPKVICFEQGPFVGRVRALGVECQVCPLPSRLSRLTRLYRRYSLPSYLAIGLQSAGFVHNLHGQIKSSDPDLVHTNGIKAHLLAGMAAKLAQVPVVWHIRDFISPRGTPRMFLLLARILPTRIVVNSDAVGRQFASSSKVMDKVVRVYNGLNLDEYHPCGRGARIRAELGIGANAPLVGIVAHMAPWKGHECFLLAARCVAKSAPDVRFLVVGGETYMTDGHAGYKARLEGLCRQIGLNGRVIFTGTRHDIPAVLESLDVLVHASTLPEPFGRVVVEAMAMKRPVIATAAGGVLEVVEDGENGLLVPPGDSEAMARAILRLLGDPGLAIQLGERGRQCIEARFTVRQYVEGVVRVYLEIPGLRHE